MTSGVALSDIDASVIRCPVVDGGVWLSGLPVSSAQGCLIVDEPTPASGVTRAGPVWRSLRVATGRPAQVILITRGSPPGAPVARPPGSTQLRKSGIWSARMRLHPSNAGPGGGRNQRLGGVWAPARPGSQLGAAPPAIAPHRVMQKIPYSLRASPPGVASGVPLLGSACCFLSKFMPYLGYLMSFWQVVCGYCPKHGHSRRRGRRTPHRREAG
ncbi:hypothetical protein BH11ACT6_BH11ACT6_51240 [soil metagenome]